MKIFLEEIMDVKKLFGKNVQKYRKLNKLTQEKLAELIGMDTTSISSIETGKYFVSAENLCRISQALNTSIADLFTFDNLCSNKDIYADIEILLSRFKDDSVRLNAVKNFLKALI